MDAGKGEQIVLNCDGALRDQNRDEDNFFQGNLMDKIVYTSTKVTSTGPICYRPSSFDDLFAYARTGFLRFLD